MRRRGEKSAVSAMMVDERPWAICAVDGGANTARFPPVEDEEEEEEEEEAEEEEEGEDEEGEDESMRSVSVSVESVTIFMLYPVM